VDLGAAGRDGVAVAALLGFREARDACALCVVEVEALVEGVEEQARAHRARVALHQRAQATLLEGVHREAADGDAEHEHERDERGGAP
jgi:hypothetical protein